MYIYLSLYFFNVIFNLLLKGVKGVKGASFLFIIILIVILGSRGRDVGIDTTNYYISFQQINSGYYELKDLLYFIISKAIILLGLGPEMMIFIFSLLTIIPLAYVINKDSPYPVISYAVLFAFGFYAFYFNVMRQGAAMSFGVLFFYFLVHENKRNAYLALLIASLLHLSAIILFPILFMFKGTKLFRIYILIALWPISILSAYNDSIFISILRSLSFLVPTRFLSYIEPSDLQNNGLSFIFDQFVFIVLFYIYVEMKDNIHSRYIYLGLLGIAATHFLSGVMYVDRLGLYYYIFSMMAIPIAITFIKGRISQLSVIMLLLTILLIQFSFRTSVDPHAIFPYYTIFQ